MGYFDQVSYPVTYSARAMLLSVVCCLTSTTVIACDHCWNITDNRTTFSKSHDPLITTFVTPYRYRGSTWGNITDTLEVHMLALGLLADGICCLEVGVLGESYL